MKRAAIILTLGCIVLAAGVVLWPEGNSERRDGKKEDATLDPTHARADHEQKQKRSGQRHDEADAVANERGLRASLGGLVVRRGEPVAGAEVRVRSQALTLTATTGADGRFTFDALLPEQYVLSAFTSAEASDVLGPFFLSPREHRSDFVLELLPSASVSGVVADVRTRAPLVAATVRSSSGTVLTDHAGRFRLKSLPASATWIEASAPGYETRLEWLQVDGARAHSGMELFLRSSTALRGRVTRMGQPVPSAQVWAERAELKSAIERFGPVAADGEGHFALELPSGDFQIAAAAPGGARVEGPRVTVVEGGEHEPLHVELGESLSATGTVLLDGYPAQGASLLLIDARTQQSVATTATGSGGDFRFEGLSPGSFLVQVQTAQALVAQRGPFDLTGADDAVWSIELEGAGEVHGRVDPARAGVAVRVRTSDWAGPMAAQTTTDANGRFRLSGFPAGASVEVEAEAAADHAWAHARGKVGEEVVLQLASSAVVGYAVDAEGRAVTDFLVRVIPQSGGLPRSSPVLHPRGEFRIPVPPGRFRIEASSPGRGETEGPAFAEVAAGRDSATVKLQLAPTDAVSGIVVDGHTGEPIAHAEIAVHRRRDSQAMQFERVMIVATDGQGRFTIGSVGKGARLRFRASGYRDGWAMAHQVAKFPEGRVRLAPAPGKRAQPPHRYEGIGMHLRTQPDTGALFVDGVFDGSPAQAAGIVRDDQIVSVDGHPVTGIHIQQVIPRIMGPSGTVVRLTLRRAGQLFDVAVRRRAIEI